MTETLPPQAVAAARAVPGLPRVLDDSPAVVLLVDLVAGKVTYANNLALELAPDLPLPAPVDDWAVAAGLLDVTGEALGLTGHPLSRIAAGESVSGEVVTALRGSASTRPREHLWVVGFPLTDSPVLADRALVVFLPLGNGPARQALSDAQREMNSRAVIASDLCFTISDAQAADHPIVWANPAFLRATGYQADEVVGRNCRFLQGPDTDAQTVAQIAAALRAQQPVTVTLLNYRKDGTAFWNQLSLSPVFDAAGELVNYVGVQVDVTARVAADEARAEALKDAEQAWRLASDAQVEAERAQASSELANTRLLQTMQITSALTATLDVDEALRRLTEAAVPALADWCAVNLLDADGHVRQVAVRHHDPARAADAETYRTLQPRHLLPDSPVLQVLAGGPPVLLEEVSSELVAKHVDSPELAAAIHRLGHASAMVVPLRARQRVHGTLSLVVSRGRPTYTSDDLAVAVEVGRRAGLAIDNARLYAREHDAALALQRSLLPVLPTVEGLHLHAEYHAGAQTAEVGGDWYDVLPLADGTVGLAIGDVMGHDLAAAAAMGQLRSVLRSYAWEGDQPASVLARLDRLVQALGMAQLATCCYLRLELQPDGGALATMSNAGHLPPLLRTPDGEVQMMDGVSDPLIGVPLEVARAQRSHLIPPGSLLLLYTDGLVEQRRQDLTTGLDRLAATVADYGEQDLRGLTERLLAPVFTRGLHDDVAVLAVRLA